MMRVPETKLGFTNAPVGPHLQNVCPDDTCENDPVKLLPIMVTSVPPDGGPPAGSIRVTRHGADGAARLLPVNAASSTSSVCALECRARITYQ
ncbi:MAG: hypothetical protein ACPIOQ_44025, partial [Promethearchaeia archaeon]